jgi:hypothetical protein
MQNSTLCLAFALVAALALAGTALAEPTDKPGTAGGFGTKNPFGFGLQGLGGGFANQKAKGETGSFQEWYLSVISRTFANRGAKGAGLVDGGLGGLAGLRGARGVNSVDVVERFLAFDKNQDGKVTIDELPERLQDQIAKGDANKDGSLDKEEITKLATTRTRNSPFGGLSRFGGFGGAPNQPELQKRFEQFLKDLEQLRQKP